MNYGFDTETPGWKSDRMDLLAAKLREYVTAQPPDAHDRRATVEVESWNEREEYRETLYPGVRVRRLTHYPDAQLDAMVQEFDAIYSRVMEMEWDD